VNAIIVHCYFIGFLCTVAPHGPYAMECIIRFSFSETKFSEEQNRTETRNRNSHAYAAPRPSLLRHWEYVAPCDMHADCLADGAVWQCQPRRPVPEPERAS
jgi:hypothetical protein